MNEIAGICRAVDADVDEVASVVGADWRIGPHYLKAGLGWGGSCFPKDILALRAMAWQTGRDVPVIEAALETNLRQREEALQRILHRVAQKQSPVVCVLGLSFKPNTDDLRESPAIEIIGRLSAHGVRVRAHDPVASLNATTEIPVVQRCLTSYEAAVGADLIFLATEWDDYLAMDWAQIRACMRGNHVLDGRNVLDGASLIEDGFIYEAFGRREPQNEQPRTSISVVPTDFEAPGERAA